MSGDANLTNDLMAALPDDLVVGKGATREERWAQIEDAYLAVGVDPPTGRQIIREQARRRAPAHRERSAATMAAQVARRQKTGDWPTPKGAPQVPGANPAARRPTITKNR